MYITHLVCKGQIGVNPIYYGLTAKFRPWYFDGKKVYVVTVNDYLAERDAAWMAPIYEYFGLKVSALTSTQSFEEKKSSYESNIIYCTSSELGFDYLRDNMVLFRNQKSQADLNFAIIDEGRLNLN